MAIAEVTSQRSTNGGAASTSVVFAYPATPAEGNLLVVGFSWRVDATVTVVPDGWTLATNGGNGSGIDSAIYYKIAGASEPTGHTWTLSASVKSAGVGSEWSGIHATPLDATNANTGTGTAGTTGATGVLAQAAELVVALFANDTNATWSAHDNGLTEIGEATSTGGATSTRNTSSLATKITTATTSVNYGATLSGSTVWSTAVATFKEAAGGTQFTQGLTGGASFVAAIVAQALKALTGAVSFSAAVVLGTGKILAGGLSFSVAFSANLSGAMTPALTAVHTHIE